LSREAAEVVAEARVLQQAVQHQEVWAGIAEAVMAEIRTEIGPAVAAGEEGFMAATAAEVVADRRGRRVRVMPRDKVGREGAVLLSPVLVDVREETVEESRE